MNKFIAGMCGVLGTLVAFAAPQDAKGDTLTALGGKPWLDSDSGCFSSSSFGSSVRNANCSGNPRTWLVPLTLRWTGNTVFRASDNLGPGLIPPGPRPQCRAVVRSNQDGSIWLGNLTTVSGQDIPLGTRNINSATQSGHIDCLLTHGGTGLSQIRWSTS